MRSIALESAVEGMILSIMGMIPADFGYLPAIGGAIAQEAIDLVAVLNAFWQRSAKVSGPLQQSSVLSRMTEL
jgi:hypothetical protein